MKTVTAQTVKDVAALKQKKFREEFRQILVEGRHPIEEALQAGLKMLRIFTLPHHEEGLPKADLPVTPVSVDENTMARMSSTSSPPPCLAVFEQPDESGQLTGTFALVLDGIQDPGNAGTLIRSAVAFGVSSVILTGETVEPYNPKVVRASAGMVFAVPVLAKPHEALPALFSKDGWRIYATTGHADALHYREADYTERCVIVLGNEGRGVSLGLLGENHVHWLTIPMAKNVESLNVAISGSIVLAEAAAQRRRVGA